MQIYKGEVPAKIVSGDREIPGTVQQPLTVMSLEPKKRNIFISDKTFLGGNFFLGFLDV